MADNISQEVLAPQTAAGESAPFQVGDGRSVTFSVAGDSAENVGLAAEEVPIKHLRGTYWQQAVDFNPVTGAMEDLILTASRPMIRIVAPGTYKMVKPSTAAATGLYQDFMSASTGYQSD